MDKDHRHVPAIYVKNREGGQLISAYSGLYLYYAMQELTLYLVYVIGIWANELYAIDCFKMHKNIFDCMIMNPKGYVSVQLKAQTMREKDRDQRNAFPFDRLKQFFALLFGRFSL